jgi:ATP-dependent RNA helicase RhlE
MTTFSSFGLPKTIIDNLTNNNIINPYPIQEKVIPAVLDNKDVLGVAKTGSGKTASYVLPILVKLQKIKATSSRHVKILVLVPTRELSDQVANVFKSLGEGMSGCKTLAVYGGVSINPQMISLQNIDILVATPGRLLDLVDNNAVKLGEISCLVLDEADKMLNFGFKEEMDRILSLLPAKRQNLLFSATLTKDVENLNNLVLNNPDEYKVDDENKTTDLVNQSAYSIDADKKGPFLRYLIKSKDMNQVLVFVSTGQKADNVARKLNKNGIKADSIHGKKGQNVRLENLAWFKKGKIRVLVTTDLLARGIDIEFLPFVINYDLPRSPKDYIHRIGRTGRAENSGEAITLVSQEEEHHFKVIQKKSGTWMQLIDTTDIDFNNF